MIATAGSPEKLALARSLGAGVAIDYSKAEWPAALLESTGGRKVDVVLEMVGGDVFRRSFEVLTPFARLVVCGAAGAAGATLDTIELLRPTHTVSGFSLGGRFSRGTLVQDSLATVFGDVASGWLKVADVTRFPLTAATEAHRAIHERRTTGKVVLEPWA